MNIKRILAVLAACLILAALTASCDNDNKAEGNTDSKTEAISNINKIIDVTDDGGTIEEDADKNVIEKDANGDVVSVTDKDGNELDVDEYIASHEGLKKSTSASKSSSDTEKSKTSKSSSADKSSSASKSDNSKAKSSTSSATENKTEIPKDNAEISFNDLL